MALYESEYFAAIAVHAGALNTNGAELINIAKRKTPIQIQVGTEDPLFPLPVVRKTRDVLKAANFPVELKEIPNHTHWYYDRAREINSTAWDFLKVNALSGSPVFEAHNFRKETGDSKKIAASVSQYNRGLELLRASDWSGAVFAFTSVIELDPKDADAYNNRGVAYSSQRNFEPAIADFTRSIELKPTDGAYANRAGVYFAQRKIAEAVADFSEALKLKPSAENHADRGLGYAQLGKEDLALADYDKAIQLNPKFGRSYVLRGLLALNKGQAEAAQKDFDQGFSLNPQLHEEFDGVIKEIRAARGIK
ncbi:MAG TPA: tetratricopeptide repeat protein [Pyrinomonadaceae bacterium]|nr:tetratricopeptide repeat protein [Pyrinomonadaceae bacterium]